MHEYENNVSYSQAIALKSAGFDWPTLEYYRLYAAFAMGHPLEAGLRMKNRNSQHDLASAPTLAQAQMWLRKRGVEIVVEPRYSNNKRIGYDWYVYNDCSGDYALRAPLPFNNTYEAALSAGITAGIKLITDKIKKLER